MESRIALPGKTKSIVVSSFYSCDTSCVFFYQTIYIQTERKDYTIDGKLQSSREMNEDTLIEDVSQESVSVTIWNLFDNPKNLLFFLTSSSVPSSAAKKIDSSALDSSTICNQISADSWMQSLLVDWPSQLFAASGLHFNKTLFKIQLPRKCLSLGQLVLILSKCTLKNLIWQWNFPFPVEAQLNNSEHAFDGFEGGFDAIIVEVDWDSPSLAGLRNKRQTGFPSGNQLLSPKQ